MNAMPETPPAQSAERWQGGLKVHLISNLFAPDELAGAALFSDLALYLQEQGCDVRVTTTYSYYPAWKVAPEDAQHPWRQETWRGIAVRRVRMHVPSKPGGLSRLRSDASFLAGLLRHGAHPGWQPDVVLTACPMLSQCAAQRFLYAGRGVPRLIAVQDFVVDAALELGILRFPGIGLPLRRLERWALRSAATLSTISDGMLQKLSGAVGTDRRVVLIPNWIHGSLEDEVRRQGPAERSTPPSTLLYSGNMGVKQGLPGFIEAFRTAGEGWVLNLHGGGAERAKIEHAARGVAGVVFGEVLDEGRYVAALRTCTACLVTQMPGVGGNFLPSKLLPALAVGAPVLAVADADSPLAREVRAGGFGEVVAPGDVAGLRHVLHRWGDRPDDLGRFSTQALEWGQRYRRSTVLPRYLDELRSLAKAPAGLTR